ncbi:NYN domain-containing protein [Streptomonospora nanhaiensis]|uniref:NYN domain-containing protein n=1 Tax=Streptomonospora nanhaiensis TaxID=1323731 RepID=UPI001C37F9AC|nr:NYN domain-containing protein [Streptomonospora nanhaiensis]MBV2365183.1 NYN domain-containing protein [Streptomonospora nanhaiensis]MBX9387395.1 NYN domain-containing protein [Streptomonospora nanhaiensis]
MGDVERQVAVFIDFENLVCGAPQGAGGADPVPADALGRLCRYYGNAAIRVAYADWSRFGGHQHKLAMNGIDMIHIAPAGAAGKNGADIRMAVDAVETVFIHPALEVFVLVTGDSDYSALVGRLREHGKYVVGVGTESNASRRLVSVCSEYKYWGTLVAEVDPAARPVRDAAFRLEAAEALLLRAFEEATTDTPTAASLKSRMRLLDPTFDERNHGFRNFRDFLAAFPQHVRPVGHSGADITLARVPVAS